MAKPRDKKPKKPLEDLRALRNNLGTALRKRRIAQAKQIYKAEDFGKTAADAKQNPRQKAKGELILASYNIHKCVGTDKVFNPQRIIDVIADLNADILALQEVDKRFGERSGLLDLEELKRRTGLRRVPIHSISKYGQGWHGNALFFREGNISSIEQIKLPGVEPRGALIVDFYLKSGSLRVIAAHFGLLRRSRALQAEAILSFLKNKQDMPTILLGDLNEWRIGKNSSLNGLMPFFAAMSGSPSFPSRFPILALDRVFSTPDNLIRSLDVYDTELARIASDHLPITAKLYLPNGKNDKIKKTGPINKAMPAR